MDATRAALRRIVKSFGYDPDTVVSVYMDQYEARVKYRLPNPDGTYTMQEDGFMIPEPPPAPIVAPVPVDPTPAPVQPFGAAFNGDGALSPA